MPFGCKDIAQFGRHVIVNRGVYGEGHVLALIDQSGEHKIGQSEKRTSLTDITCVHVVFRNSHGCLGCSRLYFGKFYAYVSGEFVSIVQKILECHDYFCVIYLFYNMVVSTDLQKY